MIFRNTLCSLVLYALPLAPLAAAPATVTPGTDKAGNAILPLKVESQGALAASEQACSPDKRFCVELVYQQNDAPPQLKLLRMQGKDTDARFELPALKTEARNIQLALWPHVLTLADTAQGALLGVEENASAMYSGGGANASTLHLYRIYPNGKDMALREVLALPTFGNELIRACFSDQDYRERRGACHDESEFSSRISLDNQVMAGFPRLIYQTRATSFPGNISPMSDSRSRPARKTRSLVTVVDAECTFRRTISFNAITGVYAPDKPLPDCGQYVEP